jgi:hypothetical protein
MLANYLSHHWLTLMLDDKLFLAPIGDNPQVRLFIADDSLPHTA